VPRSAPVQTITSARAFDAGPLGFILGRELPPVADEVAADPRPPVVMLPTNFLPALLAPPLPARTPRWRRPFAATGRWLAPPMPRAGGAAPHWPQPAQFPPLLLPAVAIPALLAGVCRRRCRRLPPPAPRVARGCRRDLPGRARRRGLPATGSLPPEVASRAAEPLGDEQPQASQEKAS